MKKLIDLFPMLNILTKADRMGAVQAYPYFSDKGIIEISIAQASSALEDIEVTQIKYYGDYIRPSMSMEHQSELQFYVFTVLPCDLPSA